ncbi:MAG: hypothetical protein JRI99_09600 [Deltaproteobacteria bacterium]|nr:hypothetical protein [Deltaproteobacteria bacterium]
MIRLMRSARIAPGKLVEALKFSTEIVEYTKKYEGDSFGEVGTIRWCADYEDFASWEKISDQMFADPEWFQKMDAAKDLFMPDSNHVVVMRSL